MPGTVNTGDTLTASHHFAIIPEWVLYHPNISGNALRLYGVLQRIANDKTRRAWPSRSTLAKAIGKSRNTVDRCIIELIDAGALEKRHRKTDSGDYTSNEYTVMMVPPVGRGGPIFGATGGPMDGATVAPPVVNEPEPIEPEPIEPEFAATPRPTKAERDAIWDTLIDMFGEPSPNKKALYGRQAKWLAEQAATPDTMRRVAVWIRNRWGEKAVTVNGIADHYTTAMNGTAGRSGPDAFTAAAAPCRHETGWTKLMRREGPDPVYECDGCGHTTTVPTPKRAMRRESSTIDR